jgi:hypothetical protein
MYEIQVFLKKLLFLQNFHIRSCVILNFCIFQELEV